MIKSYSHFYEVEDYVRGLKERYGIINGDLIVSPTFLSDLENVALRNHLALKHSPENKVAKARKEAIGELLKEIDRLQGIANQSQPQPYALSHSHP